MDRADVMTPSPIVVETPEHIVVFDMEHGLFTRVAPDSVWEPFVGVTVPEFGAVLSNEPAVVLLDGGDSVTLGETLAVTVNSTRYVPGQLVT